MGNCISFIIEPHEYKETEPIVTHKKGKVISNTYKEHKMSYYDSCVL